MKKQQLSKIDKFRLVFWLVALDILAWWVVGSMVWGVFTEKRVISISKADFEESYIQAPETTENPTEPSFDPKKTIYRVAKEENIDWKVLYAICMEESRGCTSPKELGDGGQSRGYFQIYKTAHPEITDEQAYDLGWSARWTAKRLKKYAEIGGWDYAIRKHNGNADINEGKWKASYQMTADYLVRIKKNIKSLN